MSRFFSSKYENLAPYVPGEQPQDRKYVKLNTNESPFSPDESVAALLGREADNLNLYPDPDYKELRKVLSEELKVSPENLIMTNGSDEILNLCFMAYCDQNTPAVFADITYGFYEVFADINRVPSRKIPLNEKFEVVKEDYYDSNGTILIANPNAPTGIALGLSDIEDILKNNEGNIVVIDEAYIAFGGESAIGLLGKYDNLLITRTFSKSMSMAGGRVGFGIASKEIIEDLNRVRYSLNPYNLSRLAEKAAIAAVRNMGYYKENIEKIKENRKCSLFELEKLGFSGTESRANFLFVKHKSIGGEELYLSLKDRGVLVRHFSKERIKDYLRITVGSREQMDILLKVLKEIIKEYENS